MQPVGQLLASDSTVARNLGQSGRIVDERRDARTEIQGLHRVGRRLGRRRPSANRMQLLAQRKGLLANQGTPLELERRGTDLWRAIVRIPSMRLAAEESAQGERESSSGLRDGAEWTRRPWIFSLGRGTQALRIASAPSPDLRSIPCETWISRGTQSRLEQESRVLLTQ